MMVDIAKLAIEVDASQATAAAKQLDSMSKSAKSADSSTSGVAVASAAAGKEASNSAYKYRMAAMQLSQVASQGAVTGNYIQALAVQLPDLALGFGTVGIVAGALAGALAGPLISALTAADEETQKLDDQINELIGSLASTERQANRTLLARLQTQAAEAADEISRLESATRGLSGRQLLAATTGDRRRIEEIAQITAEIADIEERAVGTSGRQRITLTNRRRQLESDLAALTAVDAERTEKIAELEQRRQKILEAIETVQGRINESVKTRYDNEMTMIDKAAFSLDDWLQEQLDADDRRLASRASALKAIEAIEVQQMTQQERLTDNYLTQQSQIAAALDAGVIAVEEANALKLASDQQYAAASQQITDQQTQAQIAAYATTITAMQGFSNAALAAIEAYGEESSDLGKGLLLASKVLSVAQAVMAAELSAVMTRAAYASAAMFAGPAAPGVIAAGEAAAQINRGLGYASAALIAATEFAPARALGGQVTAGTTYLVGERGPELVTMGANGYVTPNDKLGGKSAPVINVIEDASRAGTQEVQQMGEQDIVNIFVSNIQRGGAAARALQGAYGLRRAGR